MDLIVWAFWFFLPAGLANMSPVFANKIPWLNQWKTPMDFGKSWDGKRVFGDNKTWRGLIFGILIGSVVGYLIKRYAYDSSWPSYLSNMGALLGAFMGAGALIGDTVESLFKRHRGIGPGKSWFPFDQTDYIVGGLLFAYPIAMPPVGVMLAVLALYFGLHIATAYIGYLLGLKDKPV